MNHTLLGGIFSAALLVGTTGYAAAQTPAASQDQSSSSTAQTATSTAQSAKPKKMTMIGEVKSYQAGKSIEVQGMGRHAQERTFDLSASDVTANVNPNVTVGSKVRVTETIDANGHKTITIEPYTGKMHSEKHPSSSQNP
jgi:pyruvate/2-oxoglutarate dehydrogenase complex dihydrolipoamide acyltransferase (E2) component